MCADGRRPQSLRQAQFDSDLIATLDRVCAGDQPRFARCMRSHGVPGWQAPGRDWRSTGKRLRQRLRVRLGLRYWLRFRFRRRQRPRLRPGFRRRCRRLWLWFGRRPRRRCRRRHWLRQRHWRRLRRRDRRRLQWFRPRRFRLRGFAEYFVGRCGLMGRICGHPEMIPSRALAYRAAAAQSARTGTEHPREPHLARPPARISAPPNSPPSPGVRWWASVIEGKPWFCGRGGARSAYMDLRGDFPPPALPGSGNRGRLLSLSAIR